MPVMEVKWTSIIPLLIFIVQMGALCTAIRCYDCLNDKSENCLTKTCETENSCSTTLYSTGVVSKGCHSSKKGEECDTYHGITDCYCNRDMCNDVLPTTHCYACENMHGLECVEKTKECMGAGCAYMMCTAIDEQNYGNTLSKSICLPMKPSRSGCVNTTMVDDLTGKPTAQCTTCACAHDYCNAKPDASALKYHESLADGSAAITCAHFLMYGLIMIVAAATF